MATDPRTLPLADATKAKFREMFGVTWEDAPLMKNGDAQVVDRPRRPRCTGDASAEA